MAKSRSFCRIAPSPSPSPEYGGGGIWSASGVLSLLILATAAAASFGATSDRSSPADGAPAQVAIINDALRAGWEDQRLVPSKEAPDGAWCRRVYLDLIGRTPTVKELETFLKDRKDGKRKRLVDRLLGDEYLEEYATHWTTVWTNVLIGRS